MNKKSNYYYSIDLLYYSLHKIGLNGVGSYIGSPEWLKNKRATINPKNKDNECFKYAIIAALNHKQIKNHSERIFILNLLLISINGRELSFHHNQKTGKSSNKTIKQLFLVSFIHHTILKKIRLTYKSKYNHKRNNQVFLLMITDDGKKWHYLAVKKLSTLLRGITSNNHGDFYCLNCLHSYTTKEKLEKQEKACDNHDYCYCYFS